MNTFKYNYFVVPLLKNRNKDNRVNYLMQMQTPQLPLLSDLRSDLRYCCQTWMAISSPIGINYPESGLQSWCWQLPSLSPAMSVLSPSLCWAHLAWPDLDIIPDQSRSHPIQHIDPQITGPLLETSYFSDIRRHWVKIQTILLYLDFG